MPAEKISADVVKMLITETITQVSVASDKRLEAHELRTRDQMGQITRAIENMANKVAESSAQYTKGQTETNKQLAAGHAQFIKMEERHIAQLEKHDDLRDQHRKLAEAVGVLKEEQIVDTLSRRVTWKVGSIVLTGVLGGAFTFAWYIAKAITDAMIEVAKTGVTP